MVALTLESNTPHDTPAGKDRLRLQGTWNYLAGTREAQLLITGDHYTVQFKNGDLYVGTFVLDPERKPKAMDMRIEQGPARHLGLTARAIYALDGNRLLLCPARPGTDDRPKFFPGPDDPTYLFMVFERQKTTSA
jgi:uncharacterized protein (TIGR03067 family)